MTDSSIIWYRGFPMTVRNAGYYKYQYLVGGLGCSTSSNSVSRNIP
jgi:hypothetical protein